MAAVPIRMSGIMLIDFTGSTAKRTNEIGQAIEKRTALAAFDSFSNP